MLFPYYIYGDDSIPKSYFVKPIAVLCDYPFNEINKWVVTCRTWGLLKYFHPNVSAGKFDWDKVLIDKLDKIHDATTSEQINAELMQLIRLAGEHELQRDSTWNDSLNMNVNLCWLDNSFICDSIKSALRKIASLPNIASSYYIPIEGVSDIYIPKEKDYGKDVITDYKYRLISLFRYWNVIYYFYPYKYLMDQSWDATLSEFIPQFLSAFDVPSYYEVVNILGTRLNDGHGFTTKSIGYNQFTFKFITLIDSSTIIRKPPKGSLLKVGDIILSIDKKDIRTIRDSLSVMVASSNKHFSDNAVNGIILFRSIMSGCILTVLRNQQELTLNEPRKPYSNLYETTTHLPFYEISQNIAYVNLDTLKKTEIPSLMDSIKKYKGVIFDLRNYPLQYDDWDLFCYLTSTQEYCYALGYLVDTSHYGAFYKSESFTKCPDDLWENRSLYNGKVAVLINASTMSWAETRAMNFRINGFTLIGPPTAGANGGAVRLFLPGDIIALYTSYGFGFPDGTQTQRKGIIPDIEVYPTINDIMESRDEVIEAAITYINSN